MTPEEIDAIAERVAERVVEILGRSKPEPVKRSKRPRRETTAEDHATAAVAMRKAGVYPGEPHR